MRRVSLAELASLLGAELKGDPQRIVTGISSLADAGPDQVSFLSNPRYADALKESRAAAFIVDRKTVIQDRALLRVEDPYLGFAAAMEVFHGEAYSAAGISAQASVHAGATVGSDPTIEPFAVVCDGARIGDRVRIMAGAYVGPGAQVGDDTVLHPNVVLEKGVVVGRRCIIHAGTVIGSDGFGFAREGSRYRKIIQAGIVRIGDDVEIGANAAIDRAAMGETVIGDGSKLDNLVHVAHNVRIGSHCILLGQSGIAGSTTFEDGVVLTAQSGVAGHLTMGKGAVILAKTAVFKDVEAGKQVAGIPAVEAAQWRRTAAMMGKLDSLRKRLASLESEVRRIGEHKPGEKE